MKGLPKRLFFVLAIGAIFGLLLAVPIYRTVTTMRADNADRRFEYAYSKIKGLEPFYLEHGWSLSDLTREELVINHSRVQIESSFWIYRNGSSEYVTVLLSCAREEAFGTVNLKYNNNDSSAHFTELLQKKLSEELGGEFEDCTSRFEEEVCIAVRF